MPQTDTEDLRHRIEASGLLKEDHKEKLLQALPVLTKEQGEALEELLAEEQKSLVDVTAAVIGSAVDGGNQAILKEFDVFVAKAGKIVRIGEEQLLQESDQEKLDHFFDDAQP